MGRSIATSAVPIRMMGDAMRQTASLMKYTVLGVFTNMGTQAIQMSRQFETSMAKIQGLVGISAREVSKMKEEILDLGGATTKGPQELAEALYFITSSGFEGAKAMDILKESARSAAAGLGETQVVADALTSVLQAYGEGTYSAARANDILVVSVREGKSEAEEFAPALGKVLPVAAAFGASFEDVAAGVASLTRTGANAGTSAIYLRQVLSQLLKPSKQAADAMFAAGTSAAQMRQMIQEDGLLSALETLNARLGGSQYEVASTGLTKVFGNVRALTAVFSLLGPNLEANRQIFEEMSNSTGAADAAFETISETADAKFRSAMAEMQASLIRVGDAIMPMMTMFAQLGGAIMNAVQSVLSIGDGVGRLSKVFRGTIKVVLLLGAGLLIASKVGLGMFRTYSSLVRLFGNAQVVMRGLTFGMRSNSAAAMTQNNVFQGLIQTTKQQTVARAMLQRMEANGTLTMQKGLQVLAKYNSSTVQQVQLNSAAAGANATTATTYGAVAGAAGVATAATRTFGQALVASLPLVFGIATAIFTVASMFGMFGKGKDELDGDIKRIEDLNEVLGGTVELDKIDIQVAFRTNFDGARGDTGLTAEELKELEDNVIKPAKIDKAISNAIDQYGAGSSQAAQFGAAIVQRLGLTGEANEKLKSYLASELSVPAGVFDDIKFTGTGQGGGVVSAQIASAILGTDDIDGDVAASLENADFSNSTSALNALLTEMRIGITDQPARLYDMNAALENVAETIGSSFDETGNLLVFQKGLEEVATAIDNTSATASDKENMFSPFVNTAFKSITKLGDFKNEVGGLTGIMKDAENQDALIEVFTKISGSASTGAIAAKAFKTEFDKLGDHATAEEEMLAFDKALRSVTEQQYNFGEEVDDVIGKVEKQVRNTIDLADAFDNGLNPSIQAVVDEYNNYNDAIDKITAGQEAVIDFNSSGINAAIDFAEAQRDVAEALKESGGSLAYNTEEGSTAIKAIQDYTKNLGKVAAVQALDPEQGPVVASKTINDGYLSLLKQLTVGGKRTQQQAKAMLGELGIDPISLMNSITPGELDQTTPEGEKFVNDLIDGAGMAFADGGKELAPELKAFNDSLLAEIENYWDIDSPSKNASKWIGEPIMKGVIDGMTGAKSLQYAKKNIPTMLSKIKNELVTNGGFTPFGPGQFTGGGGAFGRMASGVGRPRTGTATNPYTDAGGFGDTGLGIVANITKNVASGSAGAVSNISKKLAGLTGKALQTAAANYLKTLKDKETPVLDLVNKVIGDSSSALKTVGSYISAQLSLNNAIADNTKLINTQLGLQQALAKATRDQERSVRKVGGQMGAAVTDYEQARIEELQKAYEKVQRDYSMRRANIADLIDAEDALNEARMSATEVSPDAIDAQNRVVDAQTDVNNAGLEMSKSIYDVVDAQLELTKSSIDFKINAEKAQSVFQQFADEAFPGFEYRISTVTGAIHEAGRALSDDNGTFLSALKGLGTTIFKLLNPAAAESADTDTVPDFIPPGDEPTTGGGSGPTLAQRRDKNSPFFGQKETGGLYAGFRDAVMALHPSYGLGQTKTLLEAKQTFRSLYDYYAKHNKVQMAMGGFVNRPTLATIGEAGPEMVVPLNGVGVTTALERLSAVRGMNTEKTSGGREQIFNITVNNPVPETASDSISRRMKSLSNAGLFG
jgi:TP901 family phage tail tape measure protein